MLKRGYVGFYRWFSSKHLDWHKQKYARVCFLCYLDTLDQLTILLNWVCIPVKFQQEIERDYVVLRKAYIAT